jgi:hypothetical protein
MPPRNDRRAECSYGYRDESFCIGYPFIDDDQRTRMDFVCFAHDDARLIAAAPDHHANAVEFDRLCLVIESAVRNADPSNIKAVVALIKANRAALSKANGESGTESPPTVSKGDGS